MFPFNSHLINCLTISKLSNRLETRIKANWANNNAHSYSSRQMVNLEIVMRRQNLLELHPRSS